MIDIQSLLPEVTKLLPGVAPQELMDGIQQFAKTHPDLTNDQALQALTIYLEQQQKQGPQAQPSQPLFSGLMNKLGAK